MMTMAYYAKSPDKDGIQETVQAHLHAVKTLASTGEFGERKKRPNYVGFFTILENIAWHFKMY